MYLKVCTRKYSARNVANAFFGCLIAVICTFLVYEYSLLPVNYKEPKVTSLPKLRNLPGENYTNPHPFNYVINNPYLCEGVSRIKYLIYVYSLPWNFERRDAIRQTWGQSDLFPDWPSRLIFVLGTLNETSANITKMLQKESDIYGDIIQEDFLDTYMNLTHKGMAAIKWITQYCDKIDYVLKSDDDMFINIFLFRHFIETLCVNQERFLMGHLFKKNPVYREPGPGKWLIPVEDLPGQKYYPPYLMGAAYIWDGTLASEMYQAALNTTYFWMEDVFFTGYVPWKIGATNFIDIQLYYHLGNDKGLTAFITKLLRERDLLVHEIFSPQMTFEAWRMVLQNLSKEHLKLLGSKRLKTLLNSVYELLNLNQGINNKKSQSNANKKLD